MQGYLKNNLKKTLEKIIATSIIIILLTLVFFVFGIPVDDFNISPSFIGFVGQIANELTGLTKKHEENIRPVSQQQSGNTVIYIIINNDNRKA